MNKENFKSSYYLNYKNVKYTGEEAKEKMKKLEKKIRRLWLPCCPLSKNVGTYRFQVAPLVGRGYDIHQCPICQRITMKLTLMS